MYEEKLPLVAYPLRVEYFQRCPEWHPRSLPRIVDANGKEICVMAQRPDHPGRYDQELDELAQQFVQAANTAWMAGY